VEVALMMPWLAFLFVGVLDFGFYSYAAICTQNAARAAAMQTSKDTSSQLATIACVAALGELKGLPNMIGVASCATSVAGITPSLPVAVSIAALTNATTPPCADCSLNAFAKSTQAFVTYQTLPMVPIPGVLMGQLTLTRVAEVRVRQ